MFCGIYDQQLKPKSVSGKTFNGQCCNKNWFVNNNLIRLKSVTGSARDDKGRKLIHI